MAFGMHEMLGWMLMCVQFLAPAGAQGAKPAL